ncbi:MAG: GerMN domain-containing protein [Vicinamibacterales bacterium]
MTRRLIAAAVAAVIAVGLFAWALTRGLERVMRPADAPAQETAPPPPADTPVRHITATLFYASPDGQHLVPVQREVPFGEGPVEQGRQIVLAQLTMPPAPPLVAAVPPGATLRSFYVSERGEAFVDLGREIVTAHSGGSAAELLTVYAMVNAVTANLPAIARVQILIDGREADSLAGHVDIRRPLRRNDALVRESN